MRCLPLTLLGVVMACGHSEAARVGPSAADAGVVETDAGIFRGTSPISCDEAAERRSYTGCDYWPTPVANNVWEVFDYVVVVANGQDEPARITVTGAGGVSLTGTVEPNALVKLYLPWVQALKGESFDTCTSSRPLKSSALATQGAYHLASTLPVSVYQFNALEYQGSGGPPGKSWSTCPGLSACTDPASGRLGTKFGCFAFSNDASLLLPSTAWTGTYRVAGQASMGSGESAMGSYFAVTAAQADTNVTVRVREGQSILAGAGVSGTTGTVTFTLQSGDVAQIAAPAGSGNDLSGSLVSSDKPVQVIAGTPCSVAGDSSASPTCDHLEETVFPAETLGKRYFVAPPTSPGGAVVGHFVRFYGNVDGTTLRYSPGPPDGCPASLDAGQVVECLVVKTPFEVLGNHEFGVGSFMLSGVFQNAPNAKPFKGDPSLSFAVPVEQYRAKYIFLAPDDYDESWIDVVAPGGAKVTIDGQAIERAWSPIANGFGMFRHRLSRGANAHTLLSSEPVGLQVMGFGAHTSYHYPGGLELAPIAPKPIK